VGRQVGLGGRQAQTGLNMCSGLGPERCVRVHVRVWGVFVFVVVLVLA
jgi:hypothetical protein